MSIYGHFAHQYHGKKIDFPKESFLIAGISFNRNNCSQITYDTELIMEREPDNKYDNTAISIKTNSSLIGYVPNEPQSVKDMCLENINEPLKVINIKNINGNYGIRVIPICFYIEDEVLEKELVFADN